MINYKGYTGVFGYDETIDALAGHMVDIAGEIHFEGRSVEEVKESARRAVDHYLQTCQARGVKPDRSYSGKITMSTSPEVHRAIAVAAARAKRSMNQGMEDKLAVAAGVRGSKDPGGA